jgi:flagellin
MALGVLNNLSAIYAENNLNNTNSSLQTVLQQLSSGSRINSGADDAAGLSLVNGLAANSSALTQSETNATEGVGLLDVADGALSQVTSLLDRAITLATEASNGTLNPTQEGAANQEYQSILAEINNIGSTTTYNQQAVFSGKTTAIYTGDSSTTGSSINELNIRTLSESSVGDTGGAMSYSSGNDNVFLDLSTATATAKTTDTLNIGGTTTLDVNYLVKGASGSSTTASTSITVGAGTNYENTVNGLMNAINGAGLGLNATFATQAGAGIQGGGSDTGIEITGGLVSAGLAPSSVSTSGIFNSNGIPASELLTQGQTIIISQDGTAVVTVPVNTSDNTLATLANAINTASGNTSTSGQVTTDSTKVIAAVITNGDGTQSLSLANANASLGALTVSTRSSAAPVPGLGTASVAFSSPTIGTTSGAVGANATVPPTPGSAVFAVAGVNGAGTQLSAGGSITIQNSMAGNNVTDTFIIGAGNNSGNTYYTGNGNDTMQGLANTIAGVAGLNVNATATSAGLTVTSKTSATGDNITISNTGTLTNANNTLGLYIPTDGGAVTVGSPTTTELDAGAGASQNDQLSGVIHLTNGTGTLNFTAGQANGTNNGNTYADLVSYINANSATLGVTANWTTNMPGTGDSGILLTALANNGSPVVFSTGASDTLGDATTGKPLSNEITALYAGPGAAENDAITGEFKYTGNGNTVDFNTSLLVGTQTYAELALAINQANVGVNATWSGNSLLLTNATPGVAAPVTPLINTMADATIATGGAPTVANFVAAGAGGHGDFLQGTVTFSANGKTFTFTGDGSTTTYDTLATALSQSDLGVSALWSAGALQVTSLSDSNGAITISAGALQDKTGLNNVLFSAAGSSLGSAKVPAPFSVVTGGADGSQTGTTGTLLTVDPSGTGDSLLGTAGAPASFATAILQLNPSGPNPTTIVDGSDQITGQISLTNNGITNVFVQGTGVSGGGVIYTGGTSVALLTSAINKDTVLGLSATAPGTGNGAIYLQATTAGLDTISSSASTLADINYPSGTQGAAGASVPGVTSVTGNAASVSVGLSASALASLPQGESLNSNDALGASSITIGFGSNTETFTVNSTGTGSAANTTYLQTGATLAQLAAAISGYGALGVNALATTNGLMLTSTANATSANENIIVSGGVTDTTLGTSSQVSLGSFGSENDTVTGAVNFSINGVPQSIPLTGQTVAAMIQNINNGSYGVTAGWNSSNNTVTLKSTVEGTLGNITPLGTTRVIDTADTATLSYIGSSAYDTGVSSDARNVVYDLTSGQNSTTAAATFATNAMAGSGVATTSYSDGAGQALNGSDLTNQSDARSALTSLNNAITDVAAQDGYIGAEINTLNSISHVMSTQQENVVSAQNALQATDYASATSNMSKYEILSQTGIAALAQANSVQQEVTKLLQ